MQLASDKPNFILPGPQASLDELLNLAASRYDVGFEPVKVGQLSLDILQLRDMEGYLEALYACKKPGEELTLPFWARIWPTSVLLAHFAQSLDPAKGGRMLEIGAGVGISGLFAAKRGFTVTLTDFSPDAVLFTRINILKNGLQDKANALLLDFTTDRLSAKFDYILGSEVLYREETFRPLVKFILAHLASHERAEAVMARNYTRKALKFMSLASKEFLISEKVIGFKAAGESEIESERHLTIIHRLKAKKTCQDLKAV